MSVLQGLGSGFKGWFLGFWNGAAGQPSNRAFKTFIHKPYDQ